MALLSEKRRSLRIGAAFVVRFHSLRRVLLAQGRVANTCENGVFAIVNRRLRLPRELLLEMQLPAPSGGRSHNATRTVLYRAKIVREQVLGNLMGVGVQLVEKIE